MDAWKAELRQGFGFQELIWHPAECQVDFGKRDMYVRGNNVVVKYLVVSNLSLLQRGILTMFPGRDR